ncbi:MAG: hypothetical protein K5872_22315 [Rhizobiaceae bacterium]|nr:hypothetical protein [Rhizobiaceae bacterium]MCV0408956.1 hypothetical protein [Rhizobiaceae bacterium]
MSGLVSGIGKIFQTVTSGIARVGKAVMGVGSTLFTAGAASGAAPMASGGLSGFIQNFTGGGVLGNVLTGAITQAGYGALIGGAVGALTGQGFGKGALMGGLGGALMGGIAGSQGINLDPFAGGQQATDSGITSSISPTGAAPTGQTKAIPAMPPATDMPSARVAQAFGEPTIYTPAEGFGAPVRQGGGGLGQFLSSETGGSLIQGLGKGLGDYMAAKERKDAAEADRQFLREKEDRLRASYSVDPSVLHGPVTPSTGRPTPDQKYARPRYRYDRASGSVVFG